MTARPAWPRSRRSRPHSNRGARPASRVHLVGHPVEFVVAGRELAESSAALTPITALAVALLLFLLSRSWQAVLASLVTMGTALVWTFGVLGALDWPQDSILQVLAPLVLVTGVCDAVHLIGQRRPAAPGVGRDAEWVAAARRVAGPCAVTTTTTAGAFLSFATSDLATFVRFGVIASFGVVACLVLTFVWLPVLMRALPPEAVRAESMRSTWDAALASLTSWVARRRFGVLAIAALVFAVCGAGWGLHLRVDTDGYEMYGEQSQVIRWIRFVETHLSRADQLELDLALPAGGALADPDVLGAVNDLAERVSSVDGMGEARSIVDAIGVLRRLLHDDDPAAARLGESRAENAELLELLGFRGFRVPRQLGLVRPATRAGVGRRGVSSRSGRARRRWPPSIARFATVCRRASRSPSRGRSPMGRDWVRDVQATQLRSFATALALVFVLLWIYTRSLSWSLVALLPTLLPVVGILGAMGWLGLSLDVGRAMIAAVVLGIGVDDTVHLLARFRRESLAGHERGDAIARAVRGDRPSGHHDVARARHRLPVPRDVFVADGPRASACSSRSAFSVPSSPISSCCRPSCSRWRVPRGEIADDARALVPPVVGNAERRRVRDALRGAARARLRSVAERSRLDVRERSVPAAGERPRRHRRRRRPR